MQRRAPGKTRQKVYDFVKGRLLAGQPPTVREVQKELGFKAVQTARQHLEALVKEGRLVAASGKARGYRLASLSLTYSLVPLVGCVKAGPPDTAFEEVEGYIPIDGRRAEDLFALRVRGNSMLGAAILPGDIVIVRKQPAAANGDIVVAMLRDEATIKRLRMDKGLIFLVPENDELQPIIADPSELTIIGKAIEIRRLL